MLSKQNQRYGVFVFSLLMSACTSLLPSTRQINDLPWSSYQQAQGVFAQITPTQTRLVDLQKMGIDPEKTPNVTLLNHADVTRRLVAISTLEISFLPPLVQQCLASHTECFALQIEQKHLDRKRYGNFWLDFLTFNRKVEISGWQFEALLIVQKDLVVYKLWTGKPTILQLEEERNPLGPLQGAGASILKR